MPTKQKNNNNNNRTNNDDTRSMLSLHTDQQSLILGEMMNARHRLEEENAELREQLQEAELIIQLLKLKLSQAKKIIKEFPMAMVSENEFVYNNNNDDLNGGSSHSCSSSSHWRPFDKFKRLKSRSNKKKESFANSVAPGKKTFFLPTIASPTPTKTTTEESKPPADKSLNNDTTGSEDPNNNNIVETEPTANEVPLQINQMNPIKQFKQLPKAPCLVSMSEHSPQSGRMIRKQQQQQQKEEEEKEEIQEVQQSKISLSIE